MRGHLIMLIDQRTSAWLALLHHLLWTAFITITYPKVMAKINTCENLTASSVAEVTISFSSFRLATACFSKPNKTSVLIVRSWASSNMMHEYPWRSGSIRHSLSNIPIIKLIRKIKNHKININNENKVATNLEDSEILNLIRDNLFCLTTKNCTNK